MNIIETTPAKAAGSKQAKYFRYSQNNSGGHFDIDDTVAHHVIIQAHTSQDADRRAVEIGIYFNGCDDDRDCPCCGDRWSTAWGDGDDTPLIYDTPPETYDDTFTPKGEPVCHVYHLDGSKTTYRKPEGATK